MGKGTKTRKEDIHNKKKMFAYGLQPEQSGWYVVYRYADAVFNHFTAYYDTNDKTWEIVRSDLKGGRILHNASDMRYYDYTYWREA